MSRRRGERQQRRSVERGPSRLAARRGEGREGAGHILLGRDEKEDLGSPVRSGPDDLVLDEHVLEIDPAQVILGLEPHRLREVPRRAHGDDGPSHHGILDHGEPQTVTEFSG